MKSPELIAAEWLVVGFVKSWDFRMLNMQIKTTTGKDNGEFQFLPDSFYWSGRAQVRSYIAQNWPKLNAFLISASPEQQIKAAAEITKLNWNGERPKGSLSSHERNELSRSRKDLRAATTSYRQSRDVFKAHSIHNWNVCK